MIIKYTAISKKRTKKANTRSNLRYLAFLPLEESWIYRKIKKKKVRREAKGKKKEKEERKGEIQTFLNS